MNQPAPRLILASASPRRSELLRQLGFEFIVATGDVEEVQPTFLTPQEICQVNAYRKARVVAKKYPDFVVLGADTIVTLNGHVYGKPGTVEDARRMLQAFQGQAHQVVTGVCLVHLRAHRQRVFAESTRVTFHPLTDEGIANYLQQVNPLDKAGGYAIQEHGELIIRRIDGSYSNVVGLPVEKLKSELAPFIPSSSPPIPSTGLPPWTFPLQP